MSDLSARVAKLESDVEYIKRDVSELRTDVRNANISLTSLDNTTRLIQQDLAGMKSQLNTMVTTDALKSAISSAINKQILWTITALFAALGVARWLFG